MLLELTVDWDRNKCFQCWKNCKNYSSLPIVVKPNAGLPKQRGNETYYDVEPEEFAQTMEKIVDMGASYYWRLLWNDTRSHPCYDYDV